MPKIITINGKIIKTGHTLLSSNTESSWIYPQQDEDKLLIQQLYSIEFNNNELEIT